MDINFVNIFSDENILQVASQGLDPKQLYPFTDQLPESGIQRGSVFMGNPILRMRIAHYCAAFKAFSDSLIPSFFMSDVSESLRSLTKNERMSESLVF